MTIFDTCNVCGMTYSAEVGFMSSKIIYSTCHHCGTTNTINLNDEQCDDLDYQDSNIDYDGADD